MSDIVERLRSEDVEPTAIHGLLDEAADEIERLRARVEEVEYWNGAVAVCSDHVQDIVALDPKACVICDEEKLRAALREIADDYVPEGIHCPACEATAAAGEGHYRRCPYSIARQALEPTP